MTEIIETRNDNFHRHLPEMTDFTDIYKINMGIIQPYSHKFGCRSNKSIVWNTQIIKTKISRNK
jgi:hypothetical protein